MLAHETGPVCPVSWFVWFLSFFEPNKQDEPNEQDRHAWEAGGRFQHPANGR